MLETPGYSEGLDMTQLSSEQIVASEMEAAELHQPSTEPRLISAHEKLTTSPKAFQRVRSHLGFPPLNMWYGCLVSEQQS